ncbi:hypothetical protein HCN44_010922 [Aphidius gifuensis]|uniref:Uncharacterized protein n=1 Tax=Aphidius gifuensis TaxID=684658 RepID=A0A834Y762_APHGI|nr:hypothetical protein HCN44_010922 [Aphidius gifuensis]
MNVYKTSIDAAKVELIETQLNLKKIEKKSKQALDNLGESCELMSQVDVIEENLNLKTKFESQLKKKDLDLINIQNKLYIKNINKIHIKKGNEKLLNKIGEPKENIKILEESHRQEFNDSMFDTSLGRLPSIYDGLRNSGNTTSTNETLQVQLKSREGEIQMLQ